MFYRKHLPFCNDGVTESCFLSPSPLLLVFEFCTKFSCPVCSPGCGRSNMIICDPEFTSPGKFISRLNSFYYSCSTFRNLIHQTKISCPPCSRHEYPFKSLVMLQYSLCPFPIQNSLSHQSKFPFTLPKTPSTILGL